jgi:restriction endonuclease
MKSKFKKQAFQTRAVEAVVACFKGQPNTSIKFWGHTPKEGRETGR